jgi:hypothetical protein
MLDAHLWCLNHQITAAVRGLPGVGGAKGHAKTTFVDEWGRG